VFSFPLLGLIKYNSFHYSTSTFNYGHSLTSPDSLSSPDSLFLPNSVKRLCRFPSVKPLVLPQVMPDSHLNFGYLRFWLQLKRFETATVLTQSKAYPKHYTQFALYHKHFPPACTEVQASHLQLNLPRAGVLQTASL
jgi:hypothetical protein